MLRNRAFATLLFLFCAAGCGPAVVYAPRDMGQLEPFHLAPEGMAFEVDLPARTRPRRGREMIAGFEEPARTTEWQVKAADQSAVFVVTHVEYPGGLTSGPGAVGRMLEFMPRHVAEKLGGRLTSRRAQNAPGGVRGVAFQVTAPDRSRLEGRFLVREDVGLLAVFAASAESPWRETGERMLRSLRFL